MIQNKTNPATHHRHFVNNTIQYAAFSVILLSLSLIFGMIGYRFFAHIPWIDAFYNASMILTGMGPVLDMETLPQPYRNPAKIFAGLYALYSGVVFLAAAGLIISPILHRFFHRLHIE